MLLLPLVFGWKGISPLETCSNRTSLTYSVEESFCRVAIPLFREDSLFTFKVLGCDDVRRSVRSAFDAWSYNLPSVAFVEVFPPELPRITFEVKEAGYESHLTLATATGVWRRCGKGRDMVINVGEEQCWYTDSSFCHSVRRDRTGITLLLAVVWALSGGGVVYTLTHPFERVDSVFRIATWSVFTACPFIAWGALGPCLNCYDFTSTIVHEVGHLLGLAHSDEEGQTCGCGGSAYPCEPTLSSSNVMDSIARSRDFHCPSQDDVDGARSMIDPSLCGSKRLCYEEKNFAGYARVSLAVVYSFTLSWFIVCTRNLVCGARRGWTSRTPVASGRGGGIGTPKSGRR